MRRQNEVGEMAPERAANIQDLDGGTAVSRRRAMTIVGAVAGLPLLCPRPFAKCTAAPSMDRHFARLAVATAPLSL